MGFFSKLFGKKKNSDTFSDKEIIEAGACPNCWGRQNYDGKFVDFVKDQTKSNINYDKNHQKAFIQQFVETNVTGIQLKKDGGQQCCPTCSTKF